MRGRCSLCHPMNRRISCRKAFARSISSAVLSLSPPHPTSGCCSWSHSETPDTVLGRLSGSTLASGMISGVKRSDPCLPMNDPAVCQIDSARTLNRWKYGPRRDTYSACLAESPEHSRQFLQTALIETDSVLTIICRVSVQEKRFSYGVVHSPWPAPRAAGTAGPWCGLIEWA